MLDDVVRRPPIQAFEIVRPVLPRLGIVQTVQAVGGGIRQRAQEVRVHDHRHGDRKREAGAKCADRDGRESAGGCQ